MKRVAISLAAAVLSCAWTNHSFAQGARPPIAGARASGLSSYERETLSLALAKLNGEIDTAPEGKVIEAIDVVTLEVFDEREGIFQIANILHATTLPPILRREVLFRSGDPFRAELADETARNLRGFPQNSLVLVVPVRASRPDRVRVIVLTKDVWSLRVSWDLQASNAGLLLLRLEPTETNLAGTHVTLGTRFILRPETYALGAGFRFPRLQGERVMMGADANVILNRRTGDVEGSTGSTYVMRPLFSTRTEWSWLVSNDFRNERVRRYVDANVALFNAPSTAGRDALRDEYQAQRYTNTIAVTRSFGIEHKQDFSVGVEMNRRAFSIPALTVARMPEEVIADYRRARLPVSDTRVGPAARLRLYETRFLRTIDYETIGLQEDIRLGYDVTLKGYPVLEGLGSSRTFVGTYAAAQYTWKVGGGLVRIGGEVLNDLEESKIADGAVSADLRIHSPSIGGLGRLVFDASVLNRYRNYLNRTTLLGGDTRLRGYPTSFFAGKDYLSANLEFRSRSLNVFTVLVGFATFFDVGHAFEGFDHLRPQQSAGAGLRVLFPQLDKVVFRIDGAIPLTHDLPAGIPRSASLGIPMPTVFFAFEQAFALSTVGSQLAPTQGASAGLLGQ